MESRRTILAAAALVGLVCAAIGQVPSVTVSKPATEPAPAADSLTTLNDAFRAAYRRAQQAVLARSGPVILAEGDYLVFKQRDRRVEVPYVPAVYHALKSVAHIPLALDVMLAPHADEDPLDGAVLSELREYRDLIAAAEATLGAHGLDPEQLERQRKLIAACLRFLDAVVATRRCPPADRRAFTRRMTPLVMANVAEAARAELEALHRQVSSWRSNLMAEEWANLSVVILGSPLPRKENLTVQYFARLLGEPGEGRRITFAESIRDEPKALDLMATRTLDTAIGVDFFNDPLRMHRDLLADAAKEYLPLLIDRPQ
jgi:hypothetical protein